MKTIFIRAQFWCFYRPKKPQTLTHPSNANPEQHKWAAKLLVYDFEIYYKPGKENRVADALSRVETLQVFTLSVPTFPWVQDLRD